MSDELRIDDLIHIDARRVVGVDNEIYVLTAGGVVWRHDSPGWVPLPLPGVTLPQALDRRAIDIYMHASRYDGHGSDIHDHHRFELRVLDHLGMLWLLRRVLVRTKAESSDMYIWDKVPL